MFAAWGRFVYRYRWLVLAASILSIAAVIFSMQYGGRVGTGEFSAPEGTESGRVEDLLDEDDEDLDEDERDRIEPRAR